MKQRAAQDLCYFLYDSSFEYMNMLSCVLQYNKIKYRQLLMIISSMEVNYFDWPNVMFINENSKMCAMIMPVKRS